MFKRVFQSISKALGSKEAEVTETPESKGKAASKEAPVVPPTKRPAKSDDKGKGKAVAAKAPAQPAPAAPKKSPEELCDISSKMSKEEIKERLAFLYKRYNRATSSLDAKLRAEAEVMLNAVVAVREKVFGPL